MRTLRARAADGVKLQVDHISREPFPELVPDPDNMQALWRAVQHRQRRLGPARLAIGGLKRLS